MRSGVYLVLAVLVAGCATGETVRAPSSHGEPASPISVRIVRPDGVGPFPAVVWLHGCGGVVRGARHMDEWTRRLVRMGYVVAIPDSFSERGHPNGVCGNGGLVPALTRAGDAYTALRLLEARPDVVPERIGAIGFSHGGWTVLAALDQDVAARARAAAGAAHGFAAAIAYYPECAAGSWIPTYRTAAPLLILIGERDDWTPAPPCERLAERTRAQGQPVSLIVYPGAYHSFDSYAPVTLVPEARQGRGATIGGDSRAREDSIKQVETFFARYLRCCFLAEGLPRHRRMPGGGFMFARINHVAICSDHYALNGRFYEALFGMRPSSKPRPARSVVLGDGYVGMNLIPRRDGRTSGLDHFGIEVEDVDDTIARIAKFDSSLSAVKRPPIRPFAAYSAHDPDTNIFDLSQKSPGAQKDIYAENDWVQSRTISHIALRTRHAERCAKFYVDVFGLARLEEPNDGNFYLSDGRVTLMIIPWKITDYYGQDPARTGLDHIGFKVESVDQVKKDLEFLIGENPHMRTRALGYGAEGEARLKLFQKCPLGCFHLTDIEGVYIDVA